MIVKNEENYLQDCLKSIVNSVDEIIIVDTGSTDLTETIAEKYTDKCYRFRFESDFSSARNYSISLATGDWILSLDADERIDEANLKIIKEYINSCDNNVAGIRITKYNFFKDGGWYISSGLKLFRNNNNIKYEGEVGESVSASIKKMGLKIENINAYINHIGHSKSFESRHKKNVLYLSIFKKRLVLAPEDFSLIAYVALLERAEGHLEAALRLIKESNNNILANENFTFQLFAGHVYKANGQYENAKCCYKKALNIIPNEENAISNLGVINMCMGNIVEAISILQNGIIYNPTAWFLYMNLGLAYEMNKQYKEAVECYNYAYQGNSYFAYYDCRAKTEMDPYRMFYYETIPHYAGYMYHKALCEKMCCEENNYKEIKDNE